MRSLGEVVTALADDLFVGREAELATFREWLNGDVVVPEILDVSGPSGVGKTTLLNAFKRIAVEHGRTVVLVDGSSIPANPRGLLRALSSPVTDDINQVVATLNASCSLILFDSFDQLGW